MSDEKREKTTPRRKLKRKTLIDETTLPNNNRDSANKLYQILLTAGRLEGQNEPNLKTWTNEISKLRSRLTGPDLVDELLDWLTIHVSDAFVPKIYSVKGFREDYARLRDTMQLANKDKTHTFSVSDMTDIEREIYDRHKDRGWPRKTIKLLPEVIITTYRGYSEFLKRTKRAIKEGKLEYDHLADFADLLIANWGITVAEYVDDYLNMIHRTHINWEGWSGVIKPIHPGTAKFDEEGEQAADDWGRLDYWQKLKTALGYE